MKCPWMCAFALAVIAFFASCKEESEPLYPDLVPEKETEEARQFYESHALELYSRLYFSNTFKYNNHSANILQLSSIGPNVYYMAACIKEGPDAEYSYKSGPLLQPVTEASAASGVLDEYNESYQEWRFNEAGELWHAVYNDKNFEYLNTNFNGGPVGMMYNFNTGQKSASGSNYQFGYVRELKGELMVASLLRFDFGNAPVSYVSNGVSWQRRPLDKVPYTTSDKPITFDFEGFESDRLFLAWTSLADKVYMSEYKNGFWSDASAQTCEPLSDGTGLNGRCKIYIFKNGQDVNKPYVVVPKGEVMDVFIWDGSSLQVMYRALPVPIPMRYDALSNGAMYFDTDMAFTSNNIYLMVKRNPNENAIKRIFRLDKNSLTFEFLFPETSDMSKLDIEDIEGSSHGLYFTTRRFIQNKTITRGFSDVLYLKD